MVQDFAMVNTISASERVALWERVSGPVDQDAVRLEFLRRARAPHPPFRVRLRGAPPRGRVTVPGMVRHHYLRPPPLMPARREHMRCHKGKVGDIKKTKPRNDVVRARCKINYVQ